MEEFERVSKMAGVLFGAVSTLKGGRNTRRSHGIDRMGMG